MLVFQKILRTYSMNDPLVGQKFRRTSSRSKTAETNTAQKMKFSIKNLFSKCDQICYKLRIWSHLLKKSLMENFIFCAVTI